jgi:DNA repair protein RadC
MNIRDRCNTHGAQTLSLRDCLQALIGRELKLPSLPALESERAFFLDLETTSAPGLAAAYGLDPSETARLLATFEIARRYVHFRSCHRKAPERVSSAAVQALGKISDSLRNEPREWIGFVPIHLNQAVGELCLAERGCRTHVNVDPREFFARLLSLRPRAFILVHNHPGGSLHASEEDIDLTERMERTAAALGVRLLGHWIVTSESQVWIDPRPRISKGVVYPASNGTSRRLPPMPKTH